MTATDYIDPESADSYIPPEKGQQQQLTPSHSQTPKPWYQVALPSLSFAGVQLAWAVLIGHATAHLRKLGLSDRAVGLAWLAGPVTGTLVQPIIGALSDDCTSRLGRRRPFMIFGSLLTFVGLILFSQAGEIARRLGDPVRRSGGGSRTGLIVGLISFWVVDFAVNVLQTPTRALLADVVPVGQLQLGSALFAVANGFGKGIGYALGAFCPSIREAFAAAGGIIIILTCITAIFVREKPRPENQERRRIWSVVKETVGKSFHAVENMPDGVGRIFIVQWFTYLSLMYLFIYGCDWVGRDVFGGNGDAAPGSPAHIKFEEGVRFGNVGLLGMALLSMVLAPLTPLAVRRIGVRKIWGASLGIVGSAFLYAPWAGRTGVGVMFGLVSLAVCTAFTIPWALVSVAARGEERGLHLATFNLSQATPGLVASTTGGLLVHAGGGSLKVIMVFVGVCAICASFAVVFVDVGIVGRAAGKRVAAEMKLYGKGEGNDRDESSCDEIEMKEMRRGCVVKKREWDNLESHNGDHGEMQIPQETV